LRKQEKVWHPFVSRAAPSAFFLSRFSPFLLVLLLLPLFRLGAVLELSMAISLSPSHVCLYIRIISELTVHAIVYNMVDRAYVTNLVYMCFSPSVWLCTRALGTES
jgi:hypothetical protein